MVDRLRQQCSFGGFSLTRLYAVPALILSAWLAVGSGAVFAAPSSTDTNANCSANTVIYCGVNSVSQLITEYKNGDGKNSAVSIQNIYSYFGITANDVNSMSATATTGRVTRNGNVYVGNQRVADEGLTAERENTTASTEQVVGGTVFYTRAPSSFFADDSLSAYVVMTNGQFSFAILSNSGDPVEAKPISTTPTSTPSTSRVTPAAPKSTSSSQQSTSGQCTNLTATQASNNTRQVSAEVTYTTNNNTQPMNIIFDWGDNSAATSGGSTTAQHVYQQDGNYTITATLNFSGSGTAPSVTCTTPVSIVTASPVCGVLNLQTTNDTVTVTNFTESNSNGPANYQYSTLNWGDGSPLVSTVNLVGQTHTYTTLSPHTIIATAYFNEDGQSTPVTSQTCQQVVNFAQPSAPSSPSVTTAASTTSQLVNTGPGAIAGLFLATVAVGTLLYRAYLRYRLTH